MTQTGAAPSLHPMRELVNAARASRRLALRRAAAAGVGHTHRGMRMPERL